MSREHFESTGQLTQCKSPVHQFKLGKLHGEWRLSSNKSWSSITEAGNISTYWLRLGTAENTYGDKIFIFNLWRLSIIAAWFSYEIVV